MKIKLLVLTILLGSQGFLFGMGGPGATRVNIAGATPVQSQVPTLLEQSLQALEMNLEQKILSAEYIDLVKEVEKLPGDLIYPLILRMALRNKNISVEDKLNLLEALVFFSKEAHVEKVKGVFNKLRTVLASGIFPMNYTGDLTKKYFKISQKDSYGKDVFLMGNVLFLAIARNDLILLKLLLDAGADSNVLTKAPPKGTPPRKAHYFKPEGLNLINFITSKNNKDALRLIIESGAELNKQDLMQALSSAIIAKNIPIMKLLIKAGAGIDSIYFHGVLQLTPLMHAALINNKEIVQFLIKARADINKKIKSGPRGSEVIQTALDWAIKRGHEEIINILRQNGAKRASELEQGK